MKPGTFTQLYVQLVFAIKNREALLTINIRQRVFEYIGGIITQMNHKSIIVNGIANHIHILFGVNPSISVSDTVHEIKRSSSLFINNEKLCNCKFAWQEGYGAFTYSKSQLNDVYNYILNQDSHHKKRSFREEYIQFLNKYEIDFNEKYLFDFIENE
jgi:REP element-mobilizing transposase RayT